MHNHFPCPRRGLAHHDGGAWSLRLVSFHGCDLGGGVVLEGEGSLRWPESSPGAPGFCAIASPPVDGYGSSCATSLTWNGPLTISIDGRTVASMERVMLRIEWEPPVRPASARRGMVLDSEALDIDAQRIRVVSFEFDGDGRTVRVDEKALPRDLFDLTTMDLESIPNPSGSLNALTEVDLQRLVLDGVLRGLGVLLIDDAMESPRGDHEHEMEGCGSWFVKYTSDPPEMRVDNHWDRCRGTPKHGLGLVWDGTFTALLRWIPDPPGGLDLSIEGPLTIGGGVPKITTSRLLLHVEGDLHRGTRPLRAWGEIVGDGVTRTFDYNLTLEDPAQ